MDRMSETAMSAHAAVAEIERLENLRGPLERRTSGITWMIWGIATAAIFMSYNFLGVLVEFVNPGAMYFMPLAWMPWVAMGVVATRAVWKSANVMVPNLGNRREGIWIGVAFFVLSFFGFMLTGMTGGRFTEPAVFLGIVGLVSLFFGITGFFCRDRIERTLQGTGGAVLLVLAIVPSLLLASVDAAYAFFSLVAPLSTAVVYFTIGIALTLRG
jgi:hypothetical protein